MKILYLSTSYIPYRRADSVHVMHMCQALALAGHTVNLVYKKSSKFSEKTADPYEFYGVQNAFQLKGISRPAFKGGGLLYSWGMKRFLRRQKNNTDLIFSRDIAGALYAIEYKLPLIFETHVIPDTSNHIDSIKKILAYSELVSVVILTNGLLKDFKSKFINELSDQKLIVAHDAFTPKGEGPVFNINTTGRRPAIGYAGNLYAGKGMEVIGLLAGRLPEYDFNIAGGEEKDIAHWKSIFPFRNLNFVGFMPPAELASFYQKQNVLLLPPLKKSLGLSGNNIAGWMSPMKLFEYMNTGRPIVASTLEVLKEVLDDDRNALLADPEQLDEWVNAINKLIDDQVLSRTLSANAYKDLLSNHTWEKRVEHILNSSNL
tara:strand:- start:2353 stop:3474 length:1122 start_codon:yes stop_codon:yes gene_type:complete